MTSTATGLTPVKYAYDFDLEDTVTFERPPAGEKTERIQLDDLPALPRRPRLDVDAEPDDTIPSTLAVVDDPTLPTIGAEGVSAWAPPKRPGRHRAHQQPGPRRHRAPRPGLLVRALALVGINLARGAQ
jgi:hypothetical protein